VLALLLASASDAACSDVRSSELCLPAWSAGTASRDRLVSAVAGASAAAARQAGALRAHRAGPIATVSEGSLLAARAGNLVFPATDRASPILAAGRKAGWLYLLT